jgi:outer membrane lipoprotein-sorting protein
VRVATVVRVVVILALGVLPLLAAAAGEAPPSSALPGPELISRMAQVYRSCASYRDTGTVSIVYFEKFGKRTEERPFKTAFVRPDKFRFEYTETTFVGGKRQYIVWQGGRVVKTWWDVKPGVGTPSSLDMALAGATGVSGGSAHTVPRLLLSEAVSGRSLGEMKDVKRLGDTPCGEGTCARLSGVYAGSRRTVWVDLKSLLLRRLEVETVFPDFRTEETTTYEPVVDGEVPAQLLAFGEPQAK